MSSSKARTVVLTGAVAAITATGAWYGAGLKSRQEFKQEKQTIVEASTKDKISQMELTREKYIRQKAEIQAKIDQLAAKVEGKDVGGDGKVRDRRMGS